MRSNLLCIGKKFYSTQSGLRPRRSLLYVPGTDKKKIQKATTLQADVVVLDCEDGVAINKKTECRNSIQEILPTISFPSSELAIRINSIDSRYAEADLECALTSSFHPNALMIPKIETKDQIKWFKEKCSSYLGHDKNKEFNIIGQIETPLGMMNIREIMEEATSSDNKFKFQAFVFGSDDFLASIGGRRTKDAKELLFARQNFIMHVKGYNFQAIDMVDIEFKDLQGLKQQSLEGAMMGFTGKQVIHPSQIAIVNEAFSPTHEEVERANELIVAYKEHLKSGKGAFTFRDAMIDMPSVKQALNVLNLANSDQKT